MCGFYEMKPMVLASGDDKAWDDENADDWEGCCEDPYDDEDNEREWCD